MKYLSLSIALTVLAALASIGTTHAWATYNDSVDATQTASPDGIAVNLTATLPPMIDPLGTRLGAIVLHDGETS